MNDNKINNFKKDLKALLEEYNAEIYVDIEGDTHGVDFALVIDFDNKEVMRFGNPSCVSHSDLK